MVKIILVLAATAVPAFGAGIWTATLVKHQRAETGAVSIPSTISPSNMYKLDDRPAQYIQGDFNWKGFSPPP